MSCFISRGTSSAQGAPGGLIQLLYSSNPLEWKKILSNPLESKKIVKSCDCYIVSVGKYDKRFWEENKIPLLVTPANRIFTSNE